MENEFDTSFDDIEGMDDMPDEEELIPVYVITGFLESGKTSLITRMLESDAFGDERTLVIHCEEGTE